MKKGYSFRELHGLSADAVERIVRSLALSTTAATTATATGFAVGSRPLWASEGQVSKLAQRLNVSTQAVIKVLWWANRYATTACGGAGFFVKGSFVSF